jgi:hypothetical protein
MPRADREKRMVRMTTTNLVLTMSSKTSSIISRARTISVSKSRTYTPPHSINVETDITVKNFRDAAQIKRYPRDLQSTVRREDTTRKDAREKRKARKEEALVKKREEVQRMKALKTKELRAKLDRIGKEGGKNLDDEGRWLGFQLRNVL